MHRKILLAEDHAFMRRSIRLICGSEGIGDLEEVATNRDLIGVLKKGQYTHLILDLTLADGPAMGVLREITRLYPDLRVLVYSSQPSSVHSESFKRQYGIEYISKEEDEDETIELLLDFLKNTTGKIRKRRRPANNPFADLTDREKQVTQYLLTGQSFEAIGEKLGIAASMVRVTKKNILGKTKAKDLLGLKDLAVFYKL
jgi:DNA-binding NarL/FixJ family response regulator